MLLSNLMKGMDLGKITQMMRPRILVIVALSSHAVILHCGLLFLYVTGIVIACACYRGLGSASILASATRISPPEVVLQ